MPMEARSVPRISVINSQTSGYQYTPSMTTLSDGQFLVTWYDLHYGDIKAQRYGADGTERRRVYRQ